MGRSIRSPAYSTTKSPRWKSLHATTPRPLPSISTTWLQQNDICHYYFRDAQKMQASTILTFKPSSFLLNIASSNSFWASFCKPKSKKCCRLTHHWSDECNSRKAPRNQIPSSGSLSCAHSVWRGSIQSTGDCSVLFCSFTEGAEEVRIQDTSHWWRIALIQQLEDSYEEYVLTSD